MVKFICRIARRSNSNLGVWFRVDLVGRLVVVTESLDNYVLLQEQGDTNNSLPFDFEVLR